MPNNISLVKFALNLVPGVGAFGAPHGIGPRLQSGPKTQVTDVLFYLDALKSVPDLADVGVLRGDGPRTSPR